MVRAAWASCAATAASAVRRQRLRIRRRTLLLDHLPWEEGRETTAATAAGGARRRRPGVARELHGRGFRRRSSRARASASASRRRLRLRRRRRRRLRLLLPLPLLARLARDHLRVRHEPGLREHLARALLTGPARALVVDAPRLRARRARSARGRRRPASAASPRRRPRRARAEGGTSPARGAVPRAFASRSALCRAMVAHRCTSPGSSAPAISRTVSSSACARDTSCLPSGSAVFAAASRVAACALASFLLAEPAPVRLGGGDDEPRRREERVHVRYGAAVHAPQERGQVHGVARAFFEYPGPPRRRHRRCARSTASCTAGRDEVAEEHALLAQRAVLLGEHSRGRRVGLRGPPPPPPPPPPPSSPAPASARQHLRCRVRRGRLPGGRPRPARARRRRARARRRRDDGLEVAGARRRGRRVDSSPARRRTRRPPPRPAPPPLAVARGEQQQRQVRRTSSMSARSVARSVGEALSHHRRRCGRNSTAGAARLASVTAPTRASSGDRRRPRADWEDPRREPEPLELVEERRRQRRLPRAGVARGAAGGAAARAGS